MSQKIKLKQKDIENIVKNIVQEQKDVNIGGETDTPIENSGDVVLIKSTKNPNDVYLFNKKTRQVLYKFKS